MKSLICFFVTVLVVSFIATANAVTVSLISSSVSVIADDHGGTDTGVFTVTFDISPTGEDVYMRDVLGVGTVDLFRNNQLYDTSSASFSMILTSVLEPGDTSGFFEIQDGTSRSIILTGVLNPHANGAYIMDMTDVIFYHGDPNDGPKTVLSILDGDGKGFQTPSIFLRGQSVPEPNTAILVAAGSLLCFLRRR